MALKLFLLIFIVFGYRIQDSMSAFQNNREFQQRKPIGDYPKEQHTRYQYNNDASQYSQNLEYGFETVHTSSAYIPVKSKGARLIPEHKNTDYYFVTINKTSNNIPKESNNIPKTVHLLSPSTMKSFRRQLTPPIEHKNFSMVPRIQGTHHHRRHRVGDCIKCPAAKILIAQKGLDGVLIEQPKLFSCYNNSILNNAYYIETLFGPSFRFLLPNGTHSFHGKIRNKKTGKYVQNCILRYTVIVQQCERFSPQDINIRSKCDPGYIWGAKCNFNCRKGYLSTDKPMICSDSLQWEGHEPECLSEPAIDERKACNFISIPENGRYACEYPNVNSNIFQYEFITPDGTLCRLKCDHNYEIPSHLLSNSVLLCKNGNWNTTVQTMCQPKIRKQ